MKEEEKLFYIRSLIPSFKCEDGCHDCCGPVPFSQTEEDRIIKKREIVSIDCPYITKEGCEIYEERPILCRLFGNVEKMRCPHGCGSVFPLSNEIERMIMGKYHQLLTKKEAV